MTFKELLIIDSTTIRLISDILKGVGRNPEEISKKKGGMKVHMLIDAVQPESIAHPLTLLFTQAFRLFVFTTENYLSEILPFLI